MDLFGRAKAAAEVAGTWWVLQGCSRARVSDLWSRVEPNSVSLLPLLSPLDCSHQIALCDSIFYRVILDIFLLNVVLCD